MTDHVEPADRRLRYVTAAWLVVALLIGTASVAGHMMIGLNNDHLSLIDSTRKLMGGAVLYVDFIDVNPPLIFAIYILPVWLSKAGLPMASSLNLFTLALVIISLIVSERVLTHGGMARAGRWFALSAITLALLTISFIHQPFGDREHLMMVLATPWFVLFSPWVQRETIPTRWRAIVAVMAAVGFAIKPYFYVFYVASVVYALFFRHSLREMLRQWEHYIVCGFAVAYFVIVLIFFREYVTIVLPLGWQTYGAINWSFKDKLHVMSDELIGNYALGGLIGMVAILFVKSARFHSGMIYLLFLMTAALVSYLLNGGWYYTQYPFIALALVFSIAVASLLIEAYETRTLWLAAMCVLVLADLGYYYAKPVLWRADWDISMQRATGHPFANADVEPHAAVRLDGHFEQHPRFMFFTTNLWAVDLLKEGSPRVNVGRYDYLWMLPGILKLQNDSAYASLMSGLAENLAADLDRHEPHMVINDLSPAKRKLPNGYNILTLLKMDPNFSKAWSHYKPVDSFAACRPRIQENCAYEVFYRVK